MQVAQEGQVISAIGWRKGRLLETLAAANPSLDLAFHLTQNSFQGKAKIQLELLDIICRAHPGSSSLASFQSKADG